MVDFSNKHLTTIEEFLEDSIKNNPSLNSADLDPKEIVFQLAEEVRLKQFRWTDNMICIPNVIRILLLEEKADKIEELEMLFSSPTFVNSFAGYVEENDYRLLMPERVEVELRSKGSSSMMYCAGRSVLTLDWPLPEEAETVDIVIDEVKKQILQVQERKPQIPLIGRLMALNADVYRNNFFVTTEITYMGRLRVVRDERDRFLRRNDFVFAQLEDNQAISNSVSRRHAKIEFHQNSFYLVDQGSANCTAVERAQDGAPIAIPVTGTRGAELKDGDIILLGSARIRFNIVDQIDMTNFAKQKYQAQVAEKRERSTPMATLKVPAIEKK